MDACAALEDTKGATLGEGAFSRDELFIVLVYALTIGLLLLGPQHVLGAYFTKRGKEVPFLLERTSYAPLFGLVLLAVIPTSREEKFQGIVTATLLGDVIVEQIYVVVSAVIGGAEMVEYARICNQCAFESVAEWYEVLTMRGCASFWLSLQLLILGLAFMSVSVDVSGFFENVATRLLRQGGNGRWL